MSIQKIALMGILLGLIIVIKYTFGFIAGVEFVTFLIIIYAVFLPFYMSSLICVSFILLTGILYGMGTWWLTYWLIFPTETLLSWSAKKLLKRNNVIFALWTGFWGFSIIFFYAFTDYLMFGKEVAIMNITTGVLINTIEGISNFIISIILFYPFQKLFSKILVKNERSWNYEENFS